MFDFLSIAWNVDPILFKIGPVAIRYYSLLFVAGFPFGYWLLTKMYRREGIDPQNIDPLLYSVLLAVIIGARLGHCLFYQPDYYLGSWEGFIEIFQPWKGGLASHGGAIGILLALWWYSNKYGKQLNFDMMWVLDRVVITVCFAGACIRLGNLFNSEIYGDVTSLPWGFIFERNGETLPKHPTQIYESLFYLLLGIALLSTYWKKAEKIYKGWIFGTFLIFLFGFRFLIEFIKEPQVGFEESMTFNMGQLLSVPFVIAGIIILILSYKYKKPALRQEPVKKNYCPAPKVRKK